MSAPSLAQVLPVAPVALGVNLLRWRRSDIDAWIAGLPNRLQPTANAPSEEDASQAPPPAQMAGEERRFDALERASRRAMRRTVKRSWKQT
jgi:hypothetical protein